MKQGEGTQPIGSSSAVVFVPFEKVDVVHNNTTCTRPRGSSEVG
jgi:hypothetical protein